MIRIKVEEQEEEETSSLPIENENWNNVGGSATSDTNNGNNVCGTLKESPLKSPELNGVVPKKKKKSKKSKQLDNSTTDSVAALASKSIKTEPVESSLSLTTQLNNSLNIQSLLRQNQIQNGWTTNLEQSIPIGTQQQQQQSLLSIKIEPIISGINQEIPLYLDQSSSLIPNLNSEKTTTATNCDIMENSGPRAGFGRRAKLNVCYSVPKKPNQFTTMTTAIQRNSDSADNLESTNNNDDNFGEQNCTLSGSGPIFGVDPSILSSTGPPEAAVPLLEEKKAARQSETKQLSYHRKKKANPKIEQQPLDSEVKAEELRRNREYHRKWKQQRLANATPEQREQIRLKLLESVRQQREKESEERRQQRLERQRQYNLRFGKQQREKLLANATPEQREQRRLKRLEKYRRQMDKESEERRQQRLERVRQYGRKRRQQLLDSGKPRNNEEH